MKVASVVLVLAPLEQYIMVKGQSKFKLIIEYHH